MDGTDTYVHVQIITVIQSEFRFIFLDQLMFVAGPTVQFRSMLNNIIFFEKFHGDFIHSQSFYQQSIESKSRRRKKFFIFRSVWAFLILKIIN